MPVFENKFSPKKAAPRKYPSMSNLNLDATEKKEELGLEPGLVKIRLPGCQEIRFDSADGQWISEAGGNGVAARESAIIKKQNQKLLDENNLLKLKLELVLDMLAQKTAESHLQENQLEQVKKQMKQRR